MPSVTINAVTMSRPHSGVCIRDENTTHTIAANIWNYTHKSQRLLGWPDEQTSLQGVTADAYSKSSPQRLQWTKVCLLKILMLKL